MGKKMTLSSKITNKILLNSKVTVIHKLLNVCLTTNTSLICKHFCK